MSGGSYDYAYTHVEDFAERLSRYPMTPERKAFSAHLTGIAAAMKAIEWVDSGDCSPPHDIDAIKRALGPMLAPLTLEALSEEHARLGEQIEKLKASMRPTEAPKGEA